MPRKAKHRRNVATVIRNLRSKKWKQGTGKLAYLRVKDDPTTVEYCCLGVVSELAGAEKTTPRIPRIQSTVVGGEYVYPFRFDGEQNYLPESAQKWWGVNCKNPYVWVPKELAKWPDDIFGEGLWETLANLNDRQYTFEKIADILDAQPYEWDGSRTENL